MDSLGGRSTIRCQLGRHLAETPYTTVAAGDTIQSNTNRSLKVETPENEFRRSSSESNSGSASGGGHLAAASGPRFVETVTINDGEGVVTDNTIPDDYETADSSKPHKLNKRVLTQRYRLDQMKTVRKRISTEDWIFEQLEKLSTVSPQPNQNSSGLEQEDTNEEIIIDLDELLACSGDNNRRAFLEMKLRNCLAPSEDVEIFIDECIEKIRLL